MEISIIFRIAAIGLITAILNMILKKHDKDDIATYVNLAGLVIVLIIVIDMLTGLFENIRNILNF
jgi:stage III sporulation protein AC